MSDAASSLHPMSVEQWAALDEDEPGELVDGHLEEEEAPTRAHELVASWLIGVLRGWIVPRGGFVLGSESKVAVSARRGRKPDVVVFFSDARCRHDSPP